MSKLVNSLGALLFLTLLCLAAGKIGTFFITEESYHWFQELNKPFWTPTNFIFPLIWTSNYLLMAFSAWLVLHCQKNHYWIALLCWGIQLILHTIWIPLFLGHQALFLSLVIVSILWTAMLVTTVLFYKISRLSGLLMLVCLLFVSFAGILNFNIWYLNR